MADENFEALMQSTIEPEETSETTEMVAEETQTEEVVPAQEEVAEVASTEMVQSETENIPTENAPTDYNEWLKKESDGLFDTKESLKSSLDKFKDYDSKVAKITELEKTQLPDDQFVKTLASMRAAGATKDQITEFVKINTEYEDFSTMTPEELKISKLVLIDGYSKDSATRKIAREFGVDDYLEGTDEYDDAKEELRISSKQDAKALEAYKAQISTVENKAEAQKLENIALRSAHEQNVRQTVPNLLNRFDGLGSINLKGSLGKEEVSLDMKFDYDEDFKKQVPALLNDFFSQEIEEITEDKIAIAKESIKGTYLTQNIDKLMNQAYMSGLAKGHEKTENKFVNPNGVPKEEINSSPSKSAVTAAEWKAFEERLWQ